MLGRWEPPHDIYLAAWVVEVELEATILHDMLHDLLQVGGGGAGATWASPHGDYHVCTSCRRGWARERAPHTATDPALKQLIEQLARAAG